MSDSQKWFYAISDHTIGPVAAHEIVALLQQQSISASTWIIAEGSEHWISVQDSPFRKYLDAPGEQNIIQQATATEGGMQTVNEPGPPLPGKWKSWTKTVLIAGWVTVIAYIVFVVHIKNRTSKTYEESSGAAPEEGQKASRGPTAEKSFDKVLGTFFALNLKKLPDDIQGFHFGSSMEEVCSNYLKQYGQVLQPLRADGNVFVILFAAFEGPRKEWGDTIRQDAWQMQFGFSQRRLVYIRKEYNSSVDPGKTAQLLRNYFNVRTSDTDLLGDPGLVQSKNYVGYVDDDAYSFFSVSFLRQTFEAHLRAVFDEFVACVKRTDFAAAPTLSGGFHLSFEGFVKAWDDPWDFKEFTRSPDHTPLPPGDGGPAIRSRLFARNLVMCSLEKLFPPEADKIGRVFDQRSLSTRFAGYKWNSPGSYFVYFSPNFLVLVGRDPSGGESNKL